jgi:mannose-1-phosphate guanylyltransferase
MARNTAAAVAAAGALVRDQFRRRHASSTCSPPTTRSTPTTIYFDAVRTAIAAASEGKLVTFGMRRPNPQPAMAISKVATLCQAAPSR